MAIVIRSLLVLLLLCPADASATPMPAPAPAPATGLQAEEICIGIGTNSKSLACLGNLAAECLAVDAITEETTFLWCFLGGGLSQQCLAGPPKSEKSCIGVGINDERMLCFGLVGWSCRGSSFRDLGIVACFLSSSLKCLFYK